MNLDPLTRLKQFADSLEDRDGIVTRWIDNPAGEKPSAFMDADSPLAIGRITVWASDEWDFETLSVESGATTYHAHLNHPTQEELAVTLMAWESKMRG